MGKAEYRDSWAWVCFMLNGPPEAREELVHYLSDLQNQNPPDLLSDRLKHRIPDSASKFYIHSLKHGKLNKPQQACIIQILLYHSPVAHLAMHSLMGFFYYPLFPRKSEKLTKPKNSP